MALEPRTSAPGKARRAASKGKPRRAAVAKASAKSTAKPAAKSAPAARTTSKAAPRKAVTKKSSEFKPSTNVRYSDRDEVVSTRKQERLTDRSKLRAARFQ